MISFFINKFRSIFGKSKKTIEKKQQHNLDEKNNQINKSTTHLPTEITSKKFRTAHHPKPPKKKKPRWDITMFDVPVVKDKTRFHDLHLPTSILHGIYDLKFQYCTPIQAEILPKSLSGSDVTGRAQTGTGKSAAFLVAIYTRLLRTPPKTKKQPGVPRALILAPTRELALQIETDAKGIGKYTRLKILSVFGGMDYNKQKKALHSKHIDIIVATPGRLLDFKHQKIVNLGHIEILVIDEADRMLDMGFIPDIRKIVYSTPHKTKRQTMFFSATLTDEVTRLSSQWTKQPYCVEIEPEQVEANSVKQITYTTTSDCKFKLLYNLITQKKLKCVLVFSNTREETRNLVNQLKSYHINSELLSGEVTQKNRLRTLENFKKGKIRVLVATDVASRGIHVSGISHVVNYNLPQDPEDYVHRIGRTGRSGATGTSISFATEDDAFYIPAIEKLLRHKIHCEYPDENLLKEISIQPKKISIQKKKAYHQKKKRQNQSQYSKKRRQQYKSKPQNSRKYKQTANK